MKRMTHPGDPDHIYSYTQLTAFNECHYRYYLMYIEDNDLEREGNAFAEFGTLCHGLIDDWAKGNLQVWELADEYDARYPDVVVHEFPRIMKSVAESTYKKGLEYFQNFPLAEQKWNILETEQKYYTEIAGRKFVGIIDMIFEDEDGKLVILDHKSKSLSTFKKEADEMYRQQELYAKFCYEKYGKYPDTLAFNLFKENGLIMQKPFDLERYHDTLQWAEDTIHNIETCDMFAQIEMKPEPTMYCNNLCDVRSACAFGTTPPPRKRKKKDENAA